MKKLLGILVFSLLLYGCETTYTEQSWPFPWSQGLNKHSFTERYLKNKSLDEIEGVWVFDNNDYEIAIVKNDFNVMSGYDYIGIVTDTIRYNWQKGEIKILLKKTATNNIFTGNYYMGDKSRIGKTFVLNKGYIEVYLPTGYYGNLQKTLFIKTWPSYQNKKQVKKKETKQETTPSSEPEDPKKENQNEEEGFDKLLKNYFGDRKLHSIEGLWGYRRDEEKEARIYLIFKSDDDDYLFKEMVIYHPIREFENKISTKVIKKISEKSYEVKRTWNNKGTISERDGIVTIINKFKLKFESDRHCYSNEEECLKEDTVYKRKIWPPKVYTDKVDLNEEQVDKLKGLLE